jgi:hypothetical protein
MKIRRWWSVGVLVLVVPLLSAGECGSTSKNGLACNLVERRAPHWVAGTGKGSIQAEVRAYCDPRPQSHALTVWLEREGSDGETFFQVGQSSTYNQASDIPPPPPGRSYSVSTGCVDGHWRVRARAEGSTVEGGTFRFTLPVDESHISVVRCHLR